MDISEQERREFALKRMAPIPGQSLTNNPEIRQPYERPPEFVSKTEALEFFLDAFLQEEKYDAIMEVLREGTPVMDLVQLFVMDAFKSGKINPNMMLLLAKPLAYILLGLAEKEGIRAEIVDDPDDDENDDDWYESDDAYGVKNMLREKLQTITDPKDDVDAPGGSLRDAFFPLPYKEPSATLLQLMGIVVGAAQRS